uniref:Phage portal protein n=1 Tax=Arsenophonus endosymbiont of Trialeurodes vaporariorum TaxID=235567 RepID=A0A3B0LVW5_9GAMM
MLAAHRVPPQLMGSIPCNVGGFGDVEKTAKVFVRNELLPLPSKMKQLNEWLGKEVMRFAEYSLGDE